MRGSVRTLSDARGHLLATRAYDPFGVPLGGTGGGDDSEGVFGHLDGEGRLAGRGNLLGQFGYTGERQDPTTGLVNLRARWYQPASARFLSRDTFPGLLRDPVSQNAYLYGGANPTTFVDPSGHFKQLIQQIAPGADFYSNPLFQAVAGAAPTQFAAGVGSGAIDQLLSLPEGLANLGMAYIQHAIQNPTQAGPASFAQYMGGRLIEHRGEILMGLSQAIGSTSDDLRSGDPYRVGHAVGEVVTGVALVVLPAGELKAAAEGAGAAEAAGATGDGIVYLRTDLSGSLKPYVGQAKNFDRFLARQAEHAASHPQSVFDFEILDQGIAKADLERFEQFYISGYGGPTTKTSVGGLSNARNQMSWTRYIAAGGDAGIP